VVSGLGPAVLSRLAVHDDLGDGRLVEVATEGLDLDRSIRAVWSRRRELPGPARRLLAQVRAAGRSGT
jgi:DNA-binding transcriptional LysR family regulator